MQTIAFVFVVVFISEAYTSSNLVIHKFFLSRKTGVGDALWLSQRAAVRVPASTIAIRSGARATEHVGSVRRIKHCVCADTSPGTSEILAGLLR